jgi:Flp pilus assembly pilin Flp
MAFRHLSTVSKLAMLVRIQSKVAPFLRRLLPTRAARRFARHQDGAAAVEFALVAVPFLALLFAILETALVFFAGQTLEAAVTDAGRLIMTGQAQGFSQADFKTQVCNRLAGGLFDCTNGVYVNVQTGLPPEKWSSLKYGLWPDGGLRNAEEETQGGRDCREAATG